MVVKGDAMETWHSETLCLQGPRSGCTLNQRHCDVTLTSTKSVSGAATAEEEPQRSEKSMCGY